MDNLIVRQAEVKDAQGIATVHVMTWQCAYRGHIPDTYLNNLSVDKRTESWKKQLENPLKGTYTFVAEDNGKVVGWCTVGVSRDDDAVKNVGELYGIYVHPNYIGKGFSSQLMNHALEVLRKETYKKATLWVLISNGKTRKWYEHKGGILKEKPKLTNATPSNYKKYATVSIFNKNTTHSALI